MFQSLRHTYYPIQPVFEKGTNGAVSYTQYLPHPLLREFIACYWELKSNYMLPEVFNYRAIADGCIDFSFIIPELDKSFIIGADTEWALFPIRKTFHILSIKFRPGILPLFFNIKASELFKAFLPLEDVLPTTYKEILFLLEEAIEKQIPVKQVLDSYFLKRVADFEMKYSSKCFFDNMSFILDNFHLSDIVANKSLTISLQHLRRLSAFYFGMSPKEFVNIVRFQHCFRIMNSGDFKENYKKNMFYDFGYYDQPHFIHEFKRKYGLLPSQTFNSNTYLL